ncbi:uncharacterized protein LOC128202991 [Mya arenaria]|uniref:uncharacterized protein LOC128202991 n=1 Tax=Mya arenaria TaxID=6604 RepID=UPI0022E2928C|nr:uncharacterized protein LOC128202991 [Mya arenaria]
MIMSACLLLSVITVIHIITTRNAQPLEAPYAHAQSSSHTRERKLIGGFHNFQGEHSVRLRREVKTAPVRTELNPRQLTEDGGARANKKPPFVELAPEIRKVKLNNGTEVFVVVEHGPKVPANILGPEGNSSSVTSNKTTPVTSNAQRNDTAFDILNAAENSTDADNFKPSRNVGNSCSIKSDTSAETNINSPGTAVIYPISFPSVFFPQVSFDSNTKKIAERKPGLIDKPTSDSANNKVTFNQTRTTGDMAFNSGDITSEETTVSHYEIQSTPLMADAGLNVKRTAMLPTVKLNAKLASLKKKVLKFSEKLFAGRTIKRNRKGT